MKISEREKKSVVLMDYERTVDSVSKRNEWIINTIIEDEFNDFEENMLCNTKENILKSAYEITAKRSIAEFFFSNELKSDEYIVLVRKAKENTDLLDVLFKYFAEKNYTSINSDKAIREWIGWFCDDEKQKKLQTETVDEKIA